MNYQLRYVDAAGAVTDRVISNPQFNGPLVRATCQLRAATRTFRRDRIIHVIDTETGEYLEGPHELNHMGHGNLNP